MKSTESKTRSENPTNMTLGVIQLSSLLRFFFEMIWWLGFCASNLDSPQSLRSVPIQLFWGVDSIHPKKQMFGPYKQIGFLEKGFLLTNYGKDVCGSHNISQYFWRGGISIHTLFIQKSSNILGSKRPERTSQELIAQAGFELIIVDHELGVSAGGR